MTWYLDPFAKARTIVSHDSSSPCNVVSGRTEWAVRVLTFPNLMLNKPVDTKLLVIEVLKVWIVGKLHPYPQTFSDRRQDILPTK